jgi:hypothetical protein
MKRDMVVEVTGETRVIKNKEEEVKGIPEEGMMIEEEVVGTDKINPTFMVAEATRKTTT